MSVSASIVFHLTLNYLKDNTHRELYFKIQKNQLKDIHFKRQCSINIIQEYKYSYKHKKKTYKNKVRKIKQFYK